MPERQVGIDIVAQSRQSVLMTRETSRKKPKAPTSPRLAARARMRRVTVVPRGSAFQMMLRVGRPVDTRSAIKDDAAARRSPSRW